MSNNDNDAFAERHQQGMSRREFLAETGRTLSMALASAGVFYELIDNLAQKPEQVAFAATQPLPPEQYIVPSTRIVNVTSAGVSGSGPDTIPVELHPLHNHIITAKIKVPANAKALQEAQHHLESVLQGLEQQFSPATSNGVTIQVAWGLPYFQHYIPSLGKSSSFFKAGTRYPEYMPVDLATSQKQKQKVYAVQEAMTFPSDHPPAGFGPVRLEQNDVVVILRSDSLDNIMAATNAIFGTGSNQAGSLFTVTSIRRGSTGGGFYGQQSIPSKVALAAKIPGAESIPPHAQVFLGFTTTLQANMAPDNIPSLETIPGQTDQWPNGYFKQGTTMHLSHLFEDLETWYGRGSQDFSAFPDRVRAMFRPGLSTASGTLTVNPPTELSDSNIAQDVQKYQAYGHSGSMQSIVRQTTPTTTNYGKTYPAGIAVSARGDFNTVDNPFHYSSDPTGNHFSTKPAAGMHFIIFQPTIGNFNRTRLAMDGYYPDGTVLKLSPRSHGAGINSVLFTTHRQNYLVPPRSHRSFPLAEFLA
ncbi:DUF7405 family protein [Ktedonobacter racemifer]|uniref:Twin-arginine translocation signal domain-containing protein n=1 Tax=Ktedonobacter racemifer DSM 44963 TaxID=485913 RepID=D6TFN3_KTERA|nr:hypothetical protein [Ktedonobacter racemifer]EFH90516.1 hypothetical protein Krac_12139 [Ktedonobacter racemifer DSM 44963]